MHNPHSDLKCLLPATRWGANPSAVKRHAGLRQAGCLRYRAISRISAEVDSFARTFTELAR